MGVFENIFKVVCFKLVLVYVVVIDEIILFWFFGLEVYSCFILSFFVLFFGEFVFERIVSVFDVWFVVIVNDYICD